eukprot:scaffold36139_cov112-Isochrysis_galbana.AAC.3
MRRWRRWRRLLAARPPGAATAPLPQNTSPPTRINCARGPRGACRAGWTGPSGRAAADPIPPRCRSANSPRAPRSAWRARFPAAAVKRCRE